MNSILGLLCVVVALAHAVMWALHREPVGMTLAGIYALLACLFFQNHRDSR